MGGCYSVIAHIGRSEMKVTVGKFIASTGKGNRIYIKCSDPEVIGDTDITEHGFLIYGIDRAKDMAAAIAALDHKIHRSESVAARVHEAIICEDEND